MTLGWTKTDGTNFYKELKVWRLTFQVHIWSDNSRRSLRLQWVWDR